MPALYDETWATRIQWERMRLALEGLGIMQTSQKAEQVPPQADQPTLNVEQPTQAPSADTILRKEEITCAGPT